MFRPVAESCRSRHPENVPHCSPRKPSRLAALHRARQTVSSATPGADAPRPVRRSSVDGERHTLPHPRPKRLRRPAHALRRLALLERRAFVAIAFPRKLVLLSLEQRSLALAAEWHNRSRFTAKRQRRATAGAGRLREEDQRGARMFCRQPKAIPRPQRNALRVLRQHIAHIEHDGCKASGLQEEIGRLQCLLQPGPRLVCQLRSAFRRHAKPEQPPQFHAGSRCCLRRQGIAHIHPGAGIAKLGDRGEGTKEQTRSCPWRTGR